MGLPAALGRCGSVTFGGSGSLLIIQSIGLMERIGLTRPWGEENLLALGIFRVRSRLLRNTCTPQVVEISLAAMSPMAYLTRLGGEAK